MKSYLNNEETKKIDQKQGTPFDLFRVIFFKNKQEALDELIKGSGLTSSVKI